MIDVQTYNRLTQSDVISASEITAFKDGVADAVIHGVRDYSKTTALYRQGYEFGLTLVQELNEQGACFLGGMQ